MQKIDKPISILFTIPNFITAGSGKALLNIVKRLNRKKFLPAVCVMRKGGSLDKEVESLGIPFIEVPFFIQVQPYHTFLLRAWRVAKIFRPYHFVIWHSFHYLDDYTEPIIARLAGAKAWIFTKKNMSWGSRAWTLRSYLASRIVIQNREMLKRFFHNCKYKVRLIHCGVDTYQFTPGKPNIKLREQWNFPEGSIIVAHVGHFVPVKNHFFLLHALSKANRNICLVCAGDFLDKLYVTEVKNLVYKLKLENRVRFLGKVDDVVGLLRSVDIFAFCSHNESFPIAVLEAMACGLPCVVTDIPAMLDMHIRDETAIITKKDNIEEFATALNFLASQPALRFQIGKAARKRVEECFSVEREVEEYEKLYLELLSVSR